MPPTLRELLAARRLGASSPMDSFQVKQDPGLLSKIGRAIDTGGRTIRRGAGAIVGADEAEPGGRDLFEAAGILGPNKPGLDLGDVAGFGLEVVLDPLTYIGGIGVLTKGAKGGVAAKRALDIGHRLKFEKLQKARALIAPPGASRTRAVKEATETVTELTGKLDELTRAGAGTLADGLGAQVRAGQRKALRLDIPFTKYGFNTNFPLGRGLTERGLGKIDDITKKLTQKADGTPRFGTGLFSSNTVKIKPRGTERGFTRFGFKNRAAQAAFDIQKGQVADAAFEAARTKAEIGTLLDISGISRNDPTALTQLTRRREEIANVSKLTNRSVALDPTVQILREKNLEVFTEQVMRGSRAGDSLFQSEIIEHMERVLSVDGKRWMKQFPAAGREALDRVSARLSSTFEGSQISRRADLAEMFTDEVNEFFTKQFGFKGYWFEIDPTKSIPQRHLSQKIATSHADLMANLAKGTARTYNKTAGDMPLAEFLAAGPLHRLDGVAFNDRSVKGIEKALQGMKLGGKGIPREIAEQALAVTEKITSPVEINALAQVYDKITNFWRAAVTIPFPGFHFRNVFSDTFLSWMGGGVDLKNFIPLSRQAMKITLSDPGIPKSIRKAFRLGGVVPAPDAASLKALQEFEKFGALKAGLVSSALKDTEVLFSQSPLLGRLLQRFPKMKNRVLNQGLPYFEQKTGAMARISENFSRILHAMAVTKKRGLTRFEAAKDVRKWLLDYGELSTFEREVLAKRTFLFYSWPRKILPRLLASHLEATNRIAFVGRLTAQPAIDRETFVPDYIRRGAAIPAGTDKQGNPRILRNLGLPTEELNRFDFTGPEGPTAGLARTIGQQLNPMARMFLEKASGKDLFLNRDSIDLDRASPLLGALGLAEEQTLPGGEKKWRADPNLLYALRNQPLSRFLTEANRVADIASEIGGGDLDPRASALEQLLASFSGLRTTSIDPELENRAKRATIRGKLIDQIREGNVGRFPLFFATEKGKAQPELGIKELLKEMSELAKEGKRLQGVKRAESAQR